MEAKQTLGQQRAKHAWDAIERARSELKLDDQKDYKIEVKRMPAGIMTSGLGHTLAFMHANDSKNVRQKVTGDLADWLLKGRGFGIEISNYVGSDSIIKGTHIEKVIIGSDSELLRRLTEESLLYLQWLTRFADAEFKTEKKTEND